MAKPYQRKDGTWEAVHYYGTDKLTGRRKKVTRYGKTAKEAKMKINVAIAEIETGTYIEPNQMTVASWLHHWLETYEKPKLKQSTYVNYVLHIEKRVAPSIGHLKLADLQADTLQQFFNVQWQTGNLKHPGKPLSPKTLRNLYVMMNTAFQQAYENGLIRKNVVALVKLPKSRQSERRVLTRLEQQKLVDALERSSERYKLAVWIALTTGMRIGEIAGLKWEDCSNDVIHVRHTVNRLPTMEPRSRKTELVIDTPKSQKSVRNIPMPQKIISLLEEHRKQQEQEIQAASGAYQDSGFVFQNALGNPVEPRTLQDTLHRITREAGLENVYFHALRHTFATRAVEQNVDIKTLSEILGHADMSTTLNLYAHSLDEQKQKMMRAMDELYEV